MEFHLVLFRCKGGVHHITGVEHNEEGKPSEAASNRQAQMENVCVKQKI